MLNIKKLILLLIVYLFVHGCQDETTIIYNNVENNSSIERESALEVENSLKGLDLYQAFLKNIDGTRYYKINNFDGVRPNLTSLYFDFKLKQFISKDNDTEIFLDGKRESFSNIEYNINKIGQLVATLNKKDIYILELLSKYPIKASRVEEYKSNIDIEGKAYKVKRTYLSNLHILEKLLNNEVFENLKEFTEKYQKKIFEGNYFRGLVFSENNKLEELKDGNYSNGGRYEITTLKGVEMLTIYPSNTNYYTDKSCYVLNFSQVWKAQCNMKDFQEEILYYDKDVYDDLELYLKEKFISINVSI